MGGIVDAKAVRAEQIAQRLLLGYVRDEPAVIDRVGRELALEDDPELLTLILNKTLQVSTEILVALAARVGANPVRAVDDAFLTRLPY